MRRSSGTVHSRPRLPRRILIVDDAPEIRELHARFLHGTGMEVATAENGSLALDVARKVVPDVIVTDVRMPIMDGLNLCRRLRADVATRDVGVVIVTGDLSERE